MADNGGSIRNGIIVGVILAVLVGGSAPWWLQGILAPAGPTPSPTPTATSTSGPTPFSSPSQSPDASVTASPLTGCVLTITFPFVSLHAEPEIQSEEIGDVPAGQYATSDTATTQFGGQTQRWFEITALERTGWVLYDTIQIDSKSADCP